MIRVIAVVTLSLLLVFVLYLPAANPAERFLSQIHSEHEYNTATWGEVRAERILARTLLMNQALSAASPVPTMEQSPSTNRMTEAVAQEMARVNQRFFGNIYFRSIDAQLLLATYRFAALIEWIPLQAFFVIATMIDGFVVRILRAKQFEPHDPEWFALHASAFVLIACSSIAAFVTPVTITPELLAMLPVSATFFLSRMAANFHRHG